MTNKYFEQSTLWGQAPEPYQVHVLNDILKIIPLDVSSVLDAGCGDGYITNSLPDDLNVTGLDISSEALKYVKRDTVQDSITSIPFPQKSFDLVMANDVIEHLPDQDYKKALSELQRVASKYIIITTPFMEHLPAGYVRCDECSNIYHLNHHYRRFNLTNLKDLFKQFTPICHIVTGAIWEHELPEIIDYKRSLNIYNSGFKSLCPNCGKSWSNCRPVNLKLIDQLEAYFASVRNNIRLPWERRTECITLFKRNNGNTASFHFPQRYGLLDDSYQSITAQTNIFYLNMLDFSKPTLSEVAFLPRKYPRPYFYISEGDFELGENGCTVSDGKTLKAGFFELEEQVLSIKGTSEKEGRISIAVYHNDGYQYVDSIKVLGEFEFDIEKTAPLSEYGRLYELTCHDSPIIFKEILYGKKSSEERFYDLNLYKDSRYLQIDSNSVPVLLSLSWYSDFCPSEEGFKGQLVDISEGNINSSLYGAIILFLQRESRNSQREALLACQEAAQARRESDEARRESDEARRESDEARRESDEARREAAQARRESDEARREAAQARQEVDEVHREVLLARQEAGEARREAAQARQEAHPKYLAKRIAKGVWRRITFSNTLKKKEQDNQISALLNPSIFHPAYTEYSDEGKNTKKFLMLCHDQDIDRRIVQEAQSLIDIGWKGLIIGLSYDSDDHIDYVSSIPVHRIGLNGVLPECPIFESYNKRQYWLLNNIYNRGHALFNGKIGYLSNKSFSFFSKLNYLVYRFSLLTYYQNRAIYHPLPFKRCFMAAAMLYPSEMVFAHDLTSLSAAAEITAEWGSRLIYDAHELYYEQAVFSKRQKALMKEEESDYIGRCDLVMTVNQSIAEEMAKRYSIPTPRVLLNAVDCRLGEDEDTRTKYNLRNRCNIEQNKKILLYQGGVIPRRNLELVVNAMKFLKRDDIVLILMGNGSRKEYLMRLRDNKRINNVIFVDAVAQSELLFWTSSADAGIIPYPHLDINTYYCTPNKLFEFIQAGIPILANDSPELKRFVADTEFGITAPMRNAGEIARAIEKFFEADMLDCWKTNILARKNEFSWEYEKGKFLNYLGLGQEGVV